MTPACYTIRAAGEGDITAIMNLLDEAALWLLERGLDQWQGRRERRRVFVVSDVGHRTVFLVEQAREVVATITVDELPDADFWHRDDEVQTALYLHRMAVSRAHAGIGLGAAMLDWAADQATRRGRDLLRLDAWVTNGDLHLYYKRQRFTHVRTAMVDGRGSGALFERAAHVRTGIGPALQPVVGVEMP
jgi:GNAT superfamily N-acetyltransferase